LLASASNTEADWPDPRERGDLAPRQVALHPAFTSSSTGSMFLAALQSHLTQLVLRHRVGVVDVRVFVINVELRILVEAAHLPTSKVDARRLDDDYNCRPSIPNKIVELDRRAVDRGWVTRSDPQIGQLSKRASHSAWVKLLYESFPTSVL